MSVYRAHFEDLLKKISQHILTNMEWSNCDFWALCVVGACFCGMGGSGCMWYLSLRFKDTKKRISIKCNIANIPYSNRECFIKITISTGSIPLSSEY